MRMTTTFAARVSKYRKPAATVALIVVAQIVGAEAAFAQQALAPLSSALQMVVDFVNGPFGRLCGIIAIMGLGFAAWAGRISVMGVFGVLLGMGFVFGAPALVDTFQSVASR